MKMPGCVACGSAVALMLAAMVAHGGPSAVAPTEKKMGSVSFKTQQKPGFNVFLGGAPAGTILNA